MLAASCTSIRKTARLFDFDACDDGESKGFLGLVGLEDFDASGQAIMIWVPYTNTNGQWIASKLLQGFFGAPVESLCEISVTDIACHSAQAISATCSDSLSGSRTKGALI